MEIKFWDVLIIFGFGLLLWVVFQNSFFLTGYGSAMGAYGILGYVNLYRTRKAERAGRREMNG